MARGMISDDPMSGSRMITIEIEKQFSVEAEGSFIRKALVQAAEKLAEDWIKENRDKIYERLNVDAIANMMMIEVTKQIKEEIIAKKEA